MIILLLIAGLQPALVGHFIFVLLPSRESQPSEGCCSQDLREPDINAFGGLYYIG